ncbi:hypothetical protein PCA27_12495 [Acinetobacter baumannii]|uniref:hypothetical protein n=1 Tax=Acinetobacter baumannii TaxID=470 RepID=UPI00234E171E|nr:hypothetical protein [Acinetobacter baumannii]MCE6791318.1 hypothetical protein [Acinetobacter baumannii]MDC7638690.1 hypothetical protein [Acinetobacter baumannii]MDC7661546.1 hypothetical protein [Acinetobacter baumannii]
MNLKTILSVCAISLLSACSTPPKNESIQSIRLEPKPDFSGMSLVLSCDTSKNEANVLITSPVVLENEFRFTSDKSELNLIGSVADDKSGFSKENSKKILNLIYNANTLKVTTSFTNNAEFDLAKYKTDIQNKLKACI